MRGRAQQAISSSVCTGTFVVTLIVLPRVAVIGAPVICGRAVENMYGGE